MRGITSAPVTLSKSPTRPSNPTAATSVPSGLNDAAVSDDGASSKLSGRPLVASQIRAVVSVPAVRMPQRPVR